MHVVWVTIHNVDFDIREYMADSSSNPAATTAKVKERSCSLALASGANCLDSFYRVPDVVGTQVSAIIRREPNFALLETWFEETTECSLYHRYRAAVPFNEYDLCLLRRWFTLRRGLRRAVLWLVRKVLPVELLAGTFGFLACALRCLGHLE